MGEPFSIYRFQSPPALGIQGAKISIHDRAKYTTFKGDTIGITGQGGNEETLTLQADGKILAVTEDSQGILITRISSSSNDVFFGSATYVGLAE